MRHSRLTSSRHRRPVLLGALLAACWTGGLVPPPAGCPAVEEQPIDGRPAPGLGSDLPAPPDRIGISLVPIPAPLLITPCEGQSGDEPLWVSCAPSAFCAPNFIFHVNRETHAEIEVLADSITVIEKVFDRHLRVGDYALMIVRCELEPGFYLFRFRADGVVVCERRKGLTPARTQQDQETD